MVFRGYLTGSGWKAYAKNDGPSKGMEFCGVQLRPGYRKNEKLDRVIFTPTAKGQVKDFPIHEFAGLKADDDDPKLTIDIIRRNYQAFGLRKPPHSGGWISADDKAGWTCCVEQGHYGHAARKKTWLYAVGCDLPSLVWGRSTHSPRLDDGFRSQEERRRAIKTGACQLLSKRQRAATPIPFRDCLLGMARTVRIANVA